MRGPGSLKNEESQHTGLPSPDNMWLSSSVIFGWIKTDPPLRPGTAGRGPSAGRGPPARRGRAGRPALLRHGGRLASTAAKAFRTHITTLACVLGRHSHSFRSKYCSTTVIIVYFLPTNGSYRRSFESPLLSREMFALRAFTNTRIRKI